MIRLGTDSTRFGDSFITDTLVQKPTATYQLWNPVRRFIVVDLAGRAIGRSQVIERSTVPNG
jgi:hypothetical protein